MRNYPVSIFLPIYNFNPGQLVSNVKIVHTFVSSEYHEFEVVLVDDTSGRETKEAIEKTASLKNVRTIRYDNGPSRRENLAASFLKAKYGIIAFMDIDLSTELKHLLELTDKINQGYDIVIGSRYKGITPERETYRLVLSKAYNFALWILFGSRMGDHTCGFKGFKKDAISNLIQELGYDYSGRRGWFWDAEMLIRAQKGNYRIIEIPVKWTRDAESTFYLGRESKLIPYLLSLWFSQVFHKK